MHITLTDSTRFEITEEGDGIMVAVIDPQARLRLVPHTAQSVQISAARADPEADTRARFATEILRRYDEATPHAQ